MARNWEQQKLATIDLETGEIQEGVSVVVGRRIKWKENFCMTFQDKLEEMSQDKELAGVPLRVLLALTSRVGWDNWLHVNQSEIAKTLDVRTAGVSESITSLVDKGIIIQGQKMGRCHAYKLNSNYGYKGKLQDLTAYRQKEKRHLSLVKNEGQDACEETMGLFEQ